MPYRPLMFQQVVPAWLLASRVIPSANALNVIPSLVTDAFVVASWVGSKTTVPAEATPQISVNKDNHTNRNALFIIVCFYGILPTLLHSWESIETTEASLVNNKIISPLLLFSSTTTRGQESRAFIPSSLLELVATRPNPQQAVSPLRTGLFSTESYTSIAKLSKNWKIKKYF